MLANYDESPTNSDLMQARDSRDDIAGTVVHLIERQCDQNPERTAVRFNADELTYGELERRSNQLAHYLRKRGVQRGKLVGICIHRSLEMVVGLLGILKAGGAYVPLDADYPEERIRYMMEQSAAPVLLTESALLGTLPGVQSELICVDAERADIAREATERVDLTAKPEDLAYVIYTSGSTGRPKGVMIPHRALANLLLSIAHEPGLNSSDVLLAITTLSFDIAGLEIYLPLTVGGCLVIAPRGAGRDAVQLQSLIHDCGASVMQATPTTWRMLLDSGWQGTRGLKALCGGEALARDLADALLDRVESLWNLYGPTETTIWSTVERIRKRPDPVTIGHPIANTQLYILDEHGVPVWDGTSGELYIGGAGLARGYWNSPELTGERFVANPFGDPGSRLYRTGDEVRRRTDGRIQFLGRKDNQIKIRGHRIELGEIETVLRRHPDVRDCVVAARDGGSAGDQLTAYVVAQAGAQPADRELKAHLQRNLPEFMIPAFFVNMAKIPLTPNGKVDRNSLPAPSREPLSESREVYGQGNDIERQVAELFEQVLGVPITQSDNFFDRGGNSLLAVRLFSEITKLFGIALPLGAIFEAPTVEGLTNLLLQRKCRESSCLVGIQTAGNLPPFFCVHSLGSNVVTYRALANLLGSNQPFYGLQPCGLDGRNQPLERIEDMAAKYIEEIRTVQRAGPYYLGGVCFGGIVALEMAQQLRSKGHEAALVALIDSHFPGQPTHMPKVVGHSTFVWRCDHLLGQALRQPPKELVAYGYGRLREYVRLLLGARQDSEVLNKVIQANARAEQAYKPRFYPGKLVLFWCSEWSFRAYQDKRLGWSEIAADGLEAHVVPGNHLSMLQFPNVAIVAEKLRKCLDKSRQPETTSETVFET